MALIPRLLIGNYGDNIKFGLKTSLPGFDVTVSADDNDSQKRSFNSDWTNLGKLKIIGIATSEWSQYQSQGGIVEPPNGTRLYSISGWQQSTPVAVPTGLSDIPIWEERVLNSSGEVYDDYLYASSGSNSQGTYSGARSYHSGPATTPANTIFMTPYAGVPNVAPVYNENYFYWNPVTPFPGYPGYPAYPAMPTYKPSLAYVIYANPMGAAT